MPLGDKQTAEILRVGTGLPGPGRPKGSPNRATADVRAAIALIVERNIENLEQWLQAVAVDDPARAAELFLKTLEYHVPKLSRSELTGKDGEAIRAEPATDPAVWHRMRELIGLPPIPSQRVPALTDTPVAGNLGPSAQ